MAAQAPEAVIREVTDAIGRLYKERRSGFVHSAEITRGQYQELRPFPSLMPDPSRSVAATFEYEDDALILKQVTDNILIEWLHRESRASGCKAEARVTNWRLHRIAFQTSIIVPAGAEVSIAAGEMPVVLRGDHGARVDVFFAGIG